mmetsp:Transcript_13389/g.25712  ORF Transcript_13389/g.25712 Transcript_13389/m.25712 type:complete len:207 (-) Transcript_13389:717-1337(-)
MQPAIQVRVARVGDGADVDHGSLRPELCLNHLPHCVQPVPQHEREVRGGGQGDARRRRERGRDGADFSGRAAGLVAVAGVAVGVAVAGRGDVGHAHSLHEDHQGGTQVLRPRRRRDHRQVLLGEQGSDVAQQARSVDDAQLDHRVLGRLPTRRCVGAPQGQPARPSSVHGRLRSQHLFYSLQRHWVRNFPPVLRGHVEHIDEPAAV